ncbi:hypothetical protein G6F54_013954 [Rhizopus delemar]|nr:hypothetical protein G6F54_013954 [Rhizopus delemar]
MVGACPAAATSTRWPTCCASSTGGRHEPAPVLVVAAGPAGADRRATDDPLPAHPRTGDRAAHPAAAG